MARLSTTEDIEKEIIATKKMALAGILVGSMALLVGLLAMFVA